MKCWIGFAVLGTLAGLQACSPEAQAPAESSGGEGAVAANSQPEQAA